MISTAYVPSPRLKNKSKHCGSIDGLKSDLAHRDLTGLIIIYEYLRFSSLLVLSFVFFFCHPFVSFTYVQITVKRQRFIYK